VVLDRKTHPQVVRHPPGLLSRGVIEIEGPTRAPGEPARGKMPIRSQQRLSGEQRVHLLEQPGAVGGVHGNELDSHAATFDDAADHGASAYLADGQI
jgi:hypothetical protein